MASEKLAASAGATGLRGASVANALFLNEQNAWHGSC
jgi:hypothetical protein